MEKLDFFPSAVRRWISWFKSPVTFGGSCVPPVGQVPVSRPITAESLRNRFRVTGFERGGKKARESNADSQDGEIMPIIVNTEAASGTSENKRMQERSRPR